MKGVHKHAHDPFNAEPNVKLNAIMEDPAVPHGQADGLAFSRSSLPAPPGCAPPVAGAGLARKSQPAQSMLKSGDTGQLSV